MPNLVNDIIDLGFFVPSWYRNKYGLEEQNTLALLNHYMSIGWKEGKDPSSKFSTTAYLLLNQDVRKSGVQPLMHYLLRGRAEGRQCLIPEQDEMTSYVSLKTSAQQSFDEELYLRLYPSAKNFPGGALDHFLLIGNKAGFYPSEDFDRTYYLELNPDVADAGVDAFEHFVRYGRAEGRPARRGTDFYRDKPANLNPERIAASWASQKFKVSPAATLVKLIQKGRKKAIYFSFSHDDYLKNSGGVQLCIKQENRLAQEQGALYVHLSPAAPKPYVNIEGAPESFLFHVNVNNKSVGVFETSDLCKTLAAAQLNKGAQIQTIVHCLVGLHPQAVSNVLTKLSAAREIFWIHDFTSICTNGALLKNGISFCGAPDIDTHACQMCSWHNLRERTRPVVDAFLQRHQFKFIAPSEFAADFWRNRSGFRDADIQIQSHVSLVGTKHSRPPKSLGPSSVTRIAFIGAAVHHKGWPFFKALAELLRYRPELEFYHFGSQGEDLDKIMFVEVNVDTKADNTMVSALVKHDIDVVLNLTLCNETYGLTTQEALAAGCFVVANTESGNVADMLEDQTDRARLIADPSLRNYSLYLTSDEFRKELGEFLAKERNVQHPNLSRMGLP